jgi:predicted RNA-binding protein YlxR (DUF448 family)
MCLGCNQRDAQSVMMRIALVNEVPVIDDERRFAGRGGYLHRDDACLEKFVRSKVREFRSLGCKLTPDDRRRLTEAIRIAAGELESVGIK